MLVAFKFLVWGLKNDNGRKYRTESFSGLKTKEKDKVARIPYFLWKIYLSVTGILLLGSNF